jgi:hypothetical protein
MANTQQLENPAVPELPVAGVVYSGQLVNQTNGSLRMFFIRLMSNLRALFGARGGQYLNIPYGAAQRNTDFTFTSANSAKLVTCTTEDFLNGMTLDTSDGLHVLQSGIYNYQFSIQMANTGTSVEHVVIWLRINGTDVAGTASKFDVPSKHGSSDGYLIGTCNFYVQLAANDHVELWSASSSTAVYFEAYAAQTSPYARPSIPSVVVTLSFVSNLS